MMERFYAHSVDRLFDVERSILKPLYHVRMAEKELVVTFDLPGVEKDDVTISATSDMISVEAKTRRPVRLMVGGTVQRRVEFERYMQTIRLPVTVDPEKAKAKVQNGLLTVRLPIVRKSIPIKVD